MHINDLPPELLSRIFSSNAARSLPDSALQRYNRECSNLSLVCKAWYHQVAPLMYRAVRLSSEAHVKAYVDTLRRNPELSTHTRVLRLVNVAGQDSELGLWSFLTDLQELYMSGTIRIQFAPILRLKKLHKLVMWGVTIEEATLPDDVDTSLPLLEHISFCGVKGISAIAARFFDRSSLPAIRHVAIVFSPLHSDDFLSPLPADTVVVATSEMRSSLSPTAADATLYTNRMYTIIEGYTTFTSPLKYLQLCDFEARDFSIHTLEQVLAELGANNHVTTLAVPESCQRAPEARQVEDWCRQQKIKLIYEDEVDVFHESAVPDWFVELVSPYR